MAKSAHGVDGGMGRSAFGVAIVVSWKTWLMQKQNHQEKEVNDD